MEYKRLTDKEHKYKKCVDCKYRNCQYCDDIVEIEREAHNRLCELEDKRENGTLVELPCKVGDKVYVIYDTFYSFDEITVIDGKVQHIWKMFGETKIRHIDVHFDKFSVKFDYTFEDKICIGASGCLINYSSNGIVEMFTTKEQAEAKLKELKEKE